MVNQNEIQDLNEVVQDEAAQEQISQEPVELSDEARVAFALYLSVMKDGKVTKAGTKVAMLNSS